MAYCRKCGKEIGDDYKLCPYCGEAQFSSAVNRGTGDDGATPEAKAFREIYEHYSAQQVLGNSTLLYNALGDMLGEEGKKLRNLVRMAMDAGLGKLYLEQIQTPAPDFDARSLALLTEDAALNENAAKQIQTLFHGMVGFPAPRAEVHKVEPPKQEPPRTAPAASPKERKKSHAGLIIVVLLIIAALIGCGAMYMNQMGPFAPAPTPTPSPEPTPTLARGQWSMMMEDIYDEDPQDLSDALALNRENNNFVFGSAYQRDWIRTVTFQGTLDGMPDDAWDITDWSNSNAGLPGSGIYAWVTPTTYKDKDGQALYDLTIAGNGGVKLPRRSDDLFKCYTNAESIDFGNCVDTSEVTEMDELFCYCKSLTSLDLSCFDTSNVTSMKLMFDDCSSLTNLDLSAFDTSKVTAMNAMFSSCNKLTTLDLSAFNTSKVEVMQGMFSSCYKLKTLDLSSFDTSNVQNMLSMFSYCKELETVYVSDAFVIKATATDNMFSNCPIGSASEFTMGSISAGPMIPASIEGLTPESTAVPTPELTDTPAPASRVLYGSIVGNKSSVFRNSSYHSRDIRTVRFVDSTAGKPDNAWDASDERDGSVWAWVTPHDGPSVSNYYGKLDLTIAADGVIKFNSDCRSMFNDFFYMESIDFGNCVDTSDVRDMSDMFYMCRSLESINLSCFDTSNVTSMRNMFYNCDKLTTLDLSSFDTSKVMNMSGMFNNCSGLTTLDISNFDTSNVTNMSVMFGSSRLTTVYASNRFVIGETTDTYNMFGTNPIDSISKFTIR